MTKQEFAQTIKQKYPQYKNIDDIELADRMLQKYPVYQSRITGNEVQSQPQKSQLEQFASKKEQPKEIKKKGALESAAIGFGSGVVSGITGLASTGLSLLSGASKLQPTYGNKVLGSVKEKTSSILSGGAKLTGGVSEKFSEYGKSQGAAGKVGYYGEKAAELLVPAKAVLGAKKLVSAPKEIKALTLSTKELGKIKWLDFLKSDNLVKEGTKGGLLTPTRYKVSEAVSKLATEFKDILKGSPNQIMKKAQQLGNEYKNKSLGLFKDSEKLINEKVARKQLEQALHKDLTTTYASGFEKKDVTKKAIESFFSKVKTGTNKGLEEARMAWYSEAKKSSGKLSDANKVLHNAIKEMIERSLPEEKAAIYKLYKNKMAKLFDIQEIQGAKLKTAVEEGGSVLKKGAKAVAGAGGLYGAYEFGKRLLKK